MSRKRYNSGRGRSGSSKGQFKSTSPQGSGYEDSLTTECLIRASLDKGGMEDPVLKLLFIGDSKPKQGETDQDLAFKRLKSCWLEKKERSYGMKKLLRTKMIDLGIKVDANPRWAKYSIMGASLIITPKIWINKQGEEKNFLKDFQIDEFKDSQILSETAISIQKNGYINTLAQLQVRNIIHRWDMFPEKDPVICGDVFAKKTFHFVIDDLEVLHHVLLHRPQVELLDSYYNDTERSSIQLIQQDWSEYICQARGRKRIMVRGERKVEKKSRSQSNEKYSELFRLLEQKKLDQKQDEAPIIEEKMSDAESVRSQQMFRKQLRIDPQNGIVVRQRSVVEKETAEIRGIENVFNRVNLNLRKQGAKEVDLIPKEIFPQGLTTFVEEFGCNNYLKLFIKLNWQFLEKSRRCSEEEYKANRLKLFRKIIENMINKQKMVEVQENNFQSISDLVRGLPSSIDWLFEGSEVQVFFKGQMEPSIVVARLEVESKGKLFWFQIVEENWKIVWHQIMVKFYSCLTNETWERMVRISLDDIMTCPMCEINFSALEIFKHSCPSGLALDLPKGWPK